MTVGVVRVEEELSQLTDDLDTTLQQVRIVLLATNSYTHFYFPFPSMLS